LQKGRYNVLLQLRFGFLRICGLQMEREGRRGVVCRQKRNYSDPRPGLTRPRPVPTQRRSDTPCSGPELHVCDRWEWLPYHVDVPEQMKALRVNFRGSTAELHIKLKTSRGQELPALEFFDSLSQNKARFHDIRRRSQELHRAARSRLPARASQPTPANRPPVSSR
jgi:hypothetical protein